MKDGDDSELLFSKLKYSIHYLHGGEVVFRRVPVFLLMPGSFRVGFGSFSKYPRQISTLPNCTQCRDLKDTQLLSFDTNLKFSNLQLIDE